MKLPSCVTPAGEFIWGIHRPAYQVFNLREQAGIEPLGESADGLIQDNRRNFPAGDLEEPGAAWVYEIPNALPFRGTTYIGKTWADAKAADPTAIALPAAAPVSMSAALTQFFDQADLPARADQLFQALPEAVLLALAVNSTDAEDLVRLAELACEFVYDRRAQGRKRPAGLKYGRDKQGRVGPLIRNHYLFEALVNNYYLPDDYKLVMVLRPGAQGGSEIVGDWLATAGRDGSHVFEYLRRNSYIPWGHYAANMAADAIRYRLTDLSAVDMIGLRHLYYQRTYVRVASDLGLPRPAGGKRLAEADLETLRQKIAAALAAWPDQATLQFTGTLWGWNYGFDLAPSCYRLHASHQQVHQQYALVPATVAAGPEGRGLPPTMLSYSCGDLVAAFIAAYRRQTGNLFFDDYLRAIRHNRRFDGDPGRASSLVIYEDENVLAFVPKAQTSQWELQLMTIGPVGNILEADTATRHSLDRAMLVIMKVYAGLGARLVTTIEYSKRFTIGLGPDRENGQRLLYAFLPKLPEAPGAFSEAQLRWIMGHYPEDFAIACRRIQETGGR